MGCASSKVGQKPPEQPPGHTERKDGSVNRSSRAVESRPAQPVVESNGAREASSSKTINRGIDEVGPKEKVLHSEGAWRMEGVGEEREGETVTDATGLQMRTPRTCTDRGLHYAAKSGDLSLVHKLLSNNIGSSRNPTKDESSTPVAVDIDERGMWGNTPLLVATQYAHPHVALALIAGGANTCLENERRATALHFSCAEGLVDVGRALLENGADVDPPVAAVHHPAVNGGQTVPITPLSAAATGGHTELVRLLVERGAEVDRRVSPKGADGQERRTSFSGTDGVGGSALTSAARYGHTDTCLLLIDRGASVLLKDWDARTPLLHAILGGHAQTSLALLDVARKAGCAHQLSTGELGELGKSGLVNPSRLTPLHAACDNGLHEVVKALLEAGAQVESKDGDGAAPLLRACRKGRLQCVRELLQRGADSMAEDHTGRTPLSAAHSRMELSGGEEILRLIEAAIAGSASLEDRPQPQHGKQDSQAEAEADDDDEDVLLVSDWDENVEGANVLDHCEVADGSSCTDHWIKANLEPGRQPQGGHRRNDPGGSAESEDEDVLLVGDYDPDLEERTGLAEMSSPVSASSRRASGLPELRQSLNADNILQAQRELASPAAARPIAEHTLRHPTEGVEEAKLQSGDPGNRKIDTKQDIGLHGEDVAALGNRPRGHPNESLVASHALPEGLNHHLKPEDLTAKLSTLQVAADSVGMVLATAADRIVVGHPAGGG